VTGLAVGLRSHRGVTGLAVAGLRSHRGVTDLAVAGLRSHRSSWTLGASNMKNRRLCVVQGMGRDAVGLVRSIAAPIASAGGNIVDLRQEVLHGLFTVTAVVDLSDSELRLEGFRQMLHEIGEDTGLGLRADGYVPVPRDSTRRNMLLVIVGRDAPGIIAETAELLSRYRINIESSRTVGRQGVFLLELLCDMRRCAIPEELLMADLREAMQQRELEASFQTADVFNRRKRVLVFDVEGSFLCPDVVREILTHTDLEAHELLAGGDALSRLVLAAQRLEGVGIDVLDSITRTVCPSDGTLELVQALKVLGYRIALVSRGFSFFTETLGTLLDLDHTFGVPLSLDADRRTIQGRLTGDNLADLAQERVLAQLMKRERVEVSDITVISDRSYTEPPGLRVDVDLATILSHAKRHVLSRDALLGVLGSFGMLRGVGA